MRKPSSFLLPSFFKISEDAPNAMSPCFADSLPRPQPELSLAPANRIAALGTRITVYIQYLQF